MTVEFEFLREQVPRCLRLQSCRAGNTMLCVVSSEMQCLRLSQAGLSASSIAMGLHAYGNARASMSSTDPSSISMFVNVAMLLGDLLVTAREFRRAKASALHGVSVMFVDLFICVARYALRTELFFERNRSAADLGRCDCDC